MNVDEIITRITDAESTADAYSYLQSVPRKMLDKVADQLHIDSWGHGNQWVRWAIVKEAKS